AEADAHVADVARAGDGRAGAVLAATGGHRVLPPDRPGSAMTAPGGAQPDGGGDTLEALRSMVATLVGGAGLVSGQLGRVPAVNEVGRAVVLVREAVAVDAAATATQARAGVAFARAAGRSVSVAYTLGRNPPRLA